jgi:dienelactone hydrolase
MPWMHCTKQLGWLGRLIWSIPCVAIFAASPAMGQHEDYRAQFLDYAAMRARVGTLYGEAKYTEAAEILEWGLRQFPDHIHANAYNLALMYAPLGELDKGVAALQYALDHGVWYSRFELAIEALGPYSAHAGFAGIRAGCEAQRLEAQKTAAMQFEVVTPEGYDPARRYPLFVALHGGDEDMAGFKPNWTSSILAREFIVLFVQSSQVLSMNGYDWEDAATTQRDVGQAYRQALAGYPIDTDNVLIGGFSSGGGGALSVTLAGELPVKGFVILCPQVPDSLNEEEVAGLIQRGVRGTLLTTELDQRVEAQRGMVEHLRQAGCDVRFDVTPNEGHWFPSNLGELIDEAIRHIRGK